MYYSSIDGFGAHFMARAILNHLYNLFELLVCHDYTVKVKTIILTPAGDRHNIIQSPVGSIIIHEARTGGCPGGVSIADDLPLGPAAAPQDSCRNS